MYSTCLFCHSQLGANDIVEHFPVGRRLAFDAALAILKRQLERYRERDRQDKRHPKKYFAAARAQATGRSRSARRARGA